MIRAEPGTTPADILGATTDTQAPTLSDGIFVPIAPGPTPGPTVPPVSAPEAPAIDLTVTDASFTVTWEAVAGATSYKLEVSTNAGEWVETTQGATVFSGPIAAGETVAARVRVIAAEGVSPWSEERSATRAPANVQLTGTRTEATANLSWTTAPGATAYTLTRSSTTVVPATVGRPQGVVGDAEGNVFVADTDNNRIVKMTPDGASTTYAGAAAPGATDGDRLVARFRSPNAVALDEHGNLYVADTGNNRIRKITPDGVVTTLAGSTYGHVNGPGAAAQFRSPKGLAVDSAGTLYVADSLNHAIRKITPAGVVSTWAGNGTAGLAGGSGTEVRFSVPTGVALSADGATLYVSDTNNNNIRQLTVATAYSSLLAGAFGASPSSGFADAPGNKARFNGPAGLAVDRAGNVLVADYSNNRVRKITPAGVVTTFAGNGATTSVDGPVGAATIYAPMGLDATPDGTILVAEFYGNRVRGITNGQVSTLVGTGATGATEGSTTTTAPVEVYTGPETTFADKDLQAGVTYTYVVVATNVGGRGPASNSPSYR